MARLGLDLNLGLQSLLAANKSRASANRAELEERKRRDAKAKEEQDKLAKREDPRSSTPDLYRPDEPAAQRKPLGVIPVYAVTDSYPLPQPVPAVAPERFITVHTGDKGMIAAFSPMLVDPLPPVANTDANLVAVFERDRVTFDHWSVEFSEWQGQVYSTAAPVFQHVADGVLYVAIVRSSHCYGRAYVRFAIEDALGNIIGHLDTYSVNVVTAIRADVLLSAVDLKTKAVSHSRADLYSRDLSVSRLAYVATTTANNRYEWIANAQYSDLRSVIAGLLPARHPFASCPSSAWDFLSPAASCIPTGGHVFQSGEIRNGTFYPDSKMPGYSNAATTAPSATALFAAAFSPLERRLSTLPSPITERALGFNSAKNERMIQADGVLERSVLQQPWNRCNGFEQLYQYGPGSFVNYDPAKLKQRSTTLNLSGLTASDKAIVGAEPPGAPPLTITPAREMTVDTKDVYYMRETTAQPSFVGAGQIAYVGYDLR